MGIYSKKANDEGLGLLDYLERYIWPMIPSGQRGLVLSRDEEDRILGYGPEGY